MRTFGALAAVATVALGVAFNGPAKATDLDVALDRAAQDCASQHPCESVGMFDSSYDDCAAYRAEKDAQAAQARAAAPLQSWGEGEDGVPAYVQPYDPNTITMGSESGSVNRTTPGGDSVRVHKSGNGRLSIQIR